MKNNWRLVQCDQHLIHPPKEKVLFTGSFWRTINHNSVESDWTISHAFLPMKAPKIGLMILRI